jgi:hypothetical protein
MTRSWTILFAILLGVSNTVSAHVPEEGKISVSLGPYFYRTNFGASSPGLHSPILGGGGLLVEGDIDNHAGLEVGLFYLHKVYFRRIDGGFIEEKIKIMYITMGYRYWFSDKFSAAAAFFSTYSMGDSTIVYSDFTPPNLHNTSAQDTTDYGFDFSLQWEFWRTPELAAFVDGRYARSVTPKDHEDSDHYGVLLALKYFVQEK